MVWKTLKMIDLVSRSTLTECGNMLLVACFLLIVVPIASVNRPLGCLYRKDSRSACPCKDSANALNRRLIGGTDAAVGQFPYAVVLLYAGKEYKSPHYFSGGTLITDTHVLTAAAPLTGAPDELIKVRVSERDLKDEEGGQTFNVKSIARYPNYDGSYETRFRHDIAVIKLDRPVTWGSDVQAVWLPSPYLNLEAGTIVTVFSWGSTEYGLDIPDMFQTVQVPIADHGTCVEFFRNTSFPLPIEVLCTGDVREKDDAVNGLVVRLGNKDVLCGIVSYDFINAKENVYGVYTRVSSYVDWIYENTTSAACKPCIAI